MKFKKYLLIDDELLIQMYKDGFLSYKFFEHRAIFFWCDAQMQTRGITKRKAVIEAMEKFDKSSDTIWRALRGFS